MRHGASEKKTWSHELAGGPGDDSVRIESPSVDAVGSLDDVAAWIAREHLHVVDQGAPLPLRYVDVAARGAALH